MLAVLPATRAAVWSTNNATGFGLQSNTQLATANWIAGAPLPVARGTDFVVTNSIADKPEFYRLVNPDPAIQLK